MPPTASVRTLDPACPYEFKLFGNSAIKRHVWHGRLIPLVFESANACGQGQGVVFSNRRPLPIPNSSLLPESLIGFDLSVMQADDPLAPMTDIVFMGH